MKTYGYLRVSTDKQDEDNQRHEIVKHMPIDEFIAISCSSRKSQSDRGISDLFSRLEYGDTLVVTELSRLARSTSELLLMVERFIKAKVGLIALKQGIRIPPNGEKMDVNTKVTVTMFGMMAELERDFISSRTKMGLAARKSAGVVLGRRKGALQNSGLDQHKDLIVLMLSQGASVLSISKAVGFGRTTVKSYIVSRGLSGDTPVVKRVKVPLVITPQNIADLPDPVSAAYAEVFIGGKPVGKPWIALGRHRSMFRRDDGTEYEGWL